METENQYHHHPITERGRGRGRGQSSLFNATDLNYSSSCNSVSLSNSNSNHTNQQAEDPMQSWWESVSKARSRIQALLSLLPMTSDSLFSLPDSDRPARSLLDSFQAYSAISSALSGSGDDPLCQWLYDSFLQDASESDLRLVVISLVPLIAGLYLSRIHASSTTSPTALGSPSLAGFEAVLLALYSSETKARAGKPLLVSIPSPAYLSQHPSLYHTPTPRPFSSSINGFYSRSSSSSSPPSPVGFEGIRVGIISPPLEPQMGIKSTKRASIIGVAFHCFFKHISQMPSWSKIDLCRFAASWAGEDCPCALSLDFHSSAPNPIIEQNGDDEDAGSVSDDAVSSTTIGGLLSQHPHAYQNGTAGREIILSEDITRLDINGNNTTTHSLHSNSSFEGQGHEHDQGQGVRIPLPWELLQPLMRILGHCLLAPHPLITEEIKDAASVAVRRLYARASHDLDPQAILATKSLVQLDNRARATAKASYLAAASSNANTPKKKPEVLLVSK